MYLLYYILFIQLYVDQHLGCLYHLVTVKNAAVSTCVQASISWVLLSVLLRGGIAGNFMFNFRGTTELFLTASFSTSASYILGFQFLHSLNIFKKHWN